MRRTMFFISVALMLAIEACGSGASTGAPSGAPTESAPGPSAAPSAASTTTAIDSAPSPTATATTEPPTPSATTSAAPLNQATPDLAAIKPCSLFPVSEADTVSSIEYLPGRASTSGAGRTCTYADLSAHKSVAFDVQAGSSPSDAQQAYAAAVLNASTFTVTPISGVGDGAFVSRVDQLGIESTTIYVVSGSYLIAISTVSAPPGPTDKVLEAESLLLVGRLR